MYAVVTTASVDGSLLAPDHKLLREQLIPAVRALPGVVAAYWLEPDEEQRGVALVLFESEQLAREAVGAMHVEVGSSIVPGITFTRVQVSEVIGQI